MVSSGAGLIYSKTKKINSSGELEEADGVTELVEENSVQVQREARESKLALIHESDMTDEEKAMAIEKISRPRRTAQVPKRYKE